MKQFGETTNEGTIQGGVLVAGCGYIVTAAAWALFGFLEVELAANPASTLHFVLAVAHGITGAAILGRLRAALVLGALVGLSGLVVALSGPQFVLVFTNCVILALLYLARRHLVGYSTGK